MIKQKTFTVGNKVYSTSQRYWTDYPFVALGDTPGELAPVREVSLVDYDGDKYCEILIPAPDHEKSKRVAARKVSIKIGYLYDKCQRLNADGTFTAICEVCGKEIPKYHNHCADFACTIELNRRAGGVEYTPNGLPIRCINADGLMTEHEHGDRIDYLFPVDVNYIARLDEANFEDYKAINGEEVTEEQVRDSCGETHALLYANGSIAVTIYETCSAVWALHAEKNRPAGICLGGNLWKPGEFVLSTDSLVKIMEYLDKKNQMQIKHRDKIRKKK